MEFDGINLDILPEIEGMSPFEQSVRALEAEIHESGWDQPPSSWVIVTRTDGMLTAPFPMPNAFYRDPGTTLVRLVAWLSTTSGKKTCDELVNRIGALGALHAIDIVHEVWSLRKDEGVTDEEFHQIYEASRGKLHLHPDRIETRTATFWTIDEAWGVLHREREEFPEFDLWALGDPERVFRGRVPDSLRALMGLING